MVNWHIEKNHYNTLLSYFGCGDFQNAKILVFGIEEGTDGHEVEANVVARTYSFGSFDSNGNLLSAIEPPNREKGYWEPNAQLGGKKVRDYIYRRDGILLEEKVTKGPFNEIIARITLELEQPNYNTNYWFRLMKDDQEMAEQIRGRIKTQFRTSTEDLIHTALTDWKPLPRPDMTEWPPEYQPSHTLFGIDPLLYEKAFSLKVRDEICDSNTNYSEDVQKRLNIIHNVFQGSSIPIIIGLGEIQTKKRVLENIFSEAQFLTFKSKVHPTHSSLRAEFILNGQKRCILLLPFPDRRSAEWRKRSNKHEAAGSFMLRYFQEITQEYIKPVVERTFHHN
ncbi:hypothetical protein J41TS12_14350 [Paenibacillus antibioticophila]|uniref:Uncharacterized protein n=1 Tax=Paenibacillus antibioticophila TaxID=1274374 RepID=A0A919XPG7_9BACL|nr:hypothetical protein [Paenibacillus antibioticophila]GIO36574.1 hypothetical protein J41TS12_14350 [Paenibacillus antibioticophila]